MRCEKCGSRMDENQRESLFMGTSVVFQCKSCDNQLKEHMGDSLLQHLFHHDRKDNESSLKRADPIKFH
jgi:hypothetical protein